jgi:phosphoribosylformimino-5-aminoimidazole carboxamide ribotide isomerase
MQLIPVIDLKGGAVVHARAGERARYAPIRSQLCAGSEPLEVARALLGVHPFATVYVADLDAIAGAGDNAAPLERLRRAFPAVQWWVDCGLADLAGCRAWRRRMDATPVLGSEAIRDACVLRALRAGLGSAGWVLSLDYRGERFAGDPQCLAAIDHWPERVIVMTLARVGSGAGPDLGRLAQIAARAAGRRIFAAGGVRGGEDLLALLRGGASGALVATALHERRIGRAEIAAASGPDAVERD